MYVVIFCGSGNDREQIANDLSANLCNFVSYKAKYGKQIFEIEKKGIRIDMRLADIFKAGGLRPDYVLFHNVSNKFYETWNFSMTGRYKELKSLDELIQLIILTKKEIPNNFTRRSIETVKDSLKVFAKSHNLDIGIDDFTDGRPNVIKYVFHHYMSGKGATIIIDFMEVEDLDKSIDLAIDAIIKKLNLED